jgi:hypothetical protein
VLLTGSGLRPEPANNLSATGYHPMPSEYDEQLDSTDAQLPGEYDLFDLMAQVTEENLHALDSGRCRPGSVIFSLARVRGNTPVLHFISLFYVITGDCNTLRIT